MKKERRPRQSVDPKPLQNRLNYVGGFVTVAFVLSGATMPASAIDIYQGSDWTVDLTTQLQYSAAFRVKDPSSTALAELNTNNGDANFQHGMIANQFEAVPVLSIKNGSFGLHASGEAYINTAYLQQNQNEDPASLNYTVNNPRDFPSATRNVDGRASRLLSAFAYDSYSFGANDAQSVTFKVGKQTLLWGQSLFFSNEGVAGGQAPIDVNTALTLANPQAQQIFLPVGQAVVTYQPNDWLTLQGYYQFQWQPNQLPGAGSYFWNGDFVGDGGDRIVLAEVQTPFSPSKVPLYFQNTSPDRPGSTNGQFGISAQAQAGNYDFGIYALRFDSKNPQVYVNAARGAPTPTSYGLQGGTYFVTYHRDIQLYGASVSTNVGPLNVAAEVSGRINQDLYSNGQQIMPRFTQAHPGYAIGDLVDAQASALYQSPGLPLMPGGMSIVAEAVSTSVVQVTANKSALVPGRTPSALAFEIVATPSYYNVLPNVDLTIPIGYTWYPIGSSQFDASFQAGTGSVDIGVTATYKTVWKTGINFTDYIGPETIIPPGTPKQGLADRNYVSFFISRTL